MKHTLTALLLALTTLTAQAGESDIRNSIESSFPGTKINGVAKSPINGVFEVVTDGPQGPLIIYSDGMGEHLMIGDMLNVQSKRNLTRERMDKLTEVKWDSLPLENAIKVVKGNGARKLAVFSDPDCPYCRKAEAEFNKLDDVTVYNFAYPLPMHPDAGRKSKLVWCSKDRAQAWQDLMLNGKVPSGKGDCKNPIDENLALGAKLRIDGTPAIIFPNGKRIPGYVDAKRLDAMLNGMATSKVSTRK
jgi:thiol:disulfide interchange protein DsbC